MRFISPSFGVQAAPATVAPNEDQWYAWPADFWKDASFEFIWGAAKGRAGKIVRSTAAVNGHGGVFTFEAAGTRPLAGDYMIVKAVHSGNVQAGWWPSVSGNASITAELTDLSPRTQGKQAARLTSSRGSRAAVVSYFDSMQGHTFLQMNGTYVLRFRAKGKGGNNHLHVSIARKTSPQSTYLASEVNLAPNWTDYEYAIHPA